MYADMKPTDRQNQAMLVRDAYTANKTTEESQEIITIDVRMVVPPS